MSAMPSLPLISIEDYLADELRSPVKHEYVGGHVYVMTGARNVHNTIASNVLGLAHAALRGKPCQAFNSDTKVRVRLATHTRFYYPDAMIVCDPNDGDETFQDRPVAIAEVLSESTRRIDEVEKRDVYLSIPTLGAYLLIESDRPRVVAYRRTERGFVPQAYEGPGATVTLDDVAVALPLAELYARVTFPPAGDGTE